ncbi:SPOSA6832_00144, partial [Sporobolomyces salmonicolor]
MRIARSADNPEMVHAAVEQGVKASDEWIDARAALRDAVGEEDLSKVDELCEADEELRKVCRTRRALLGLKDQVRTWEDIWGKRPRPSTADEPKAHKSTDESKDSEEEEHGWDDLDILPEDDAPSPADDDDALSTISSVNSLSSPARPSLSTFLTEPLSSTASSLAALGSLEPLHTLCTRHSDELWPSRLDILNALPEWIDPTEYLWLLPMVDPKGIEAKWEDPSPWRSSSDWSERLLSTLPPQPPASSPAPPSRRSSDELTAFYISRIEHVASLGFISTALSLVQHGASQGVLGLDELGEELSLLSKLVYDRPAADDTSIALADEDLTLSYWRSLKPEQVIRAYLAHSSPLNLATSIRRLVFPYLSVLESHLERAGTPEPTLSTRLLYDYVLSLSSSPSLDLLQAVFESSKPTLPTGARIVKDDRDLARLALACLYGSWTTSEAGIVAMGKIFECLPAFDTSLSSIDPAASPIDLFTLAGSCAASPSAPLTPSTVFSHLLTATAATLSASLDLLDLHLSQLETFSRYSCAAPLSWFLSSHFSASEQRAWATRLARTAATGGGGWEGNEDEFESEDEWVGLMEVMRELTDDQGEKQDGGGEEGKKGMGKAFWLLGGDEVLRVFFGGLLAAGRFGLARTLLNPSSTNAPLESRVVEELVISASREFYDNAEEGNLHKGEMKMAFDWYASRPFSRQPDSTRSTRPFLSAAPQTPTIRLERDFIEATSRLCSFRIHSRPGIPITPIEIRHSADRLSFVARLLASNEDAFRHPAMLLELVNKLGYRGDRLAEVRTLAMLSEAALQAGEYDRAADVCDQMVQVVETMRKVAGKGKGQDRASISSLSAFLSIAGSAPSSSTTTAPPAEEAADHAWKACFQLGKHDAYEDLSRRMQALGQALVLCPPERIATLLPVWTALEHKVAKETLKKQKEEIEAKARGGAGGGDAVTAAAAAAGAGAAKVANFLAAAATSAAHRATSPVPPPAQLAPTSTSRAQPPQLASEATTAASRTLGRAATFFPFSQAPTPAPTAVLSSSGPATTSPPRATSSHTPSSPPSRFASAFDGLTNDPSAPKPKPDTGAGGAGGGGGGFRAGLSNKFTAGVGWLIGADEVLEQEGREGYS